MSTSFVIAIDGPSASGKSTVARQLAALRGWIYVDSGSLYRGMTWKALEEGIDPQDTGAVLELLERTQWNFFVHERAVGFYIDEKFPGKALRSERVADSVSIIAAIPEVRRFLVERLRGMRELGSLVVEGRDIGTVVFPDTPYKFYLDADAAERARRRSKDNKSIGEASDVAAVRDALERRDQLDSTRATAPLQIALGATVINSTEMSLDDVVAAINRALPGVDAADG